MHSYRIGCAYYDPVKLVMYVLEDTAESSHFDVTKLRESLKILSSYAT